MRRPDVPAVAGVLGAVVVVLLAVTMVVPRPTVAGALGVAVVAVCLAALHRATFGPSFAPVAVTFWSFVAVWAGFAPLLQIRYGTLPWPDVPLYQFWVTAQVVLLFAVVAYWAGYALRRRTVRGQSPPPPAVSRPPARRFTVTVEMAVLATGFALVLTAVCLPLTGGLLVRFTTRDNLQQAIRGAGLVNGSDQSLAGLLGILPAAVSLVAMLLCLLCLRQGNRAGRSSGRLLLIATVVAIGLNVIYNNPLSANRFVTFSSMLAAVLAVVRFDRRRWRWLFTATMLVGLTVVYPLANVFRNDASRGQLRIGADAYSTIDFDGFQQTVNSVYYAHVHGHTWGYHLASALLFWVPRSLWTGKAIATGNAVAAGRGYTFQNLSLPLWAEVFVEFSLTGVVVVLYLYGRLAARLDRAVSDRPEGLAMALAVLFAACQVGLLRGPLGAQIPFVGAAFVMLTAIVVGMRGRHWGLTTVDGPAPAEPPAREPAEVPA